MDDARLLKEALQGRGGQPKPASVEFRAWLKERGVPETTLEALRGCFLAESIYVGAIEFFGAPEIEYVNDEEFIPIAVAAGLLIVGKCPNGDPVAVDFRDSPGQVGYVSHEEMWDEEDVRTAFLPLAPSLGKLVEALDDESFPCDYWEALKARKDAPPS